VKEDLFIHSSCIEHFVIRAELMDLNKLELFGVTQQKASSQLLICLLWPHKRLRLTQTWSDMLTGSWSRDLTNLNSRSMLEQYTSESIEAAKNGNSGLAGWRSIWAPSKGGEAATVPCMCTRRCVQKGTRRRLDLESDSGWTGEVASRIGGKGCRGRVG